MKRNSKKSQRNREAARKRLKVLHVQYIARLGERIALIALSLQITLEASSASAQMQSAETVARAARMFTVRIEGATQGSGFLVEREGNRYTVLTAWHVVSGQEPGEELDIFTMDGNRYPVEQGSIRRVNSLDLATLRFNTNRSYQIAQPSEARGIGTGNRIYVSGFPIPTRTVPINTWRLLEGMIVGIPSDPLDGGYQLLYSASTLPGMSGGPVLDSYGRVVGIHGQGEIDAKMTEQFGIAVKTGTNQGIPWSSWNSSNKVSKKPQRSLREGSKNGRSESSTISSLSNITPIFISESEALSIKSLQIAIEAKDFTYADKLTQEAVALSLGEEGPLTSKSIEQLSCSVLVQLDKAWMASSSGKYGFTTQMKLMSEGFANFEVIAGWRRGGFITYTESARSSYPVGYFPRLVANGPIAMKLSERFASCSRQLLGL